MKLDELESSISSRLNQIMQKLENKHTSTNRQINKSDIKELSSIINQITKEVSTLKELKTQQHDYQNDLISQLKSIIDTNKTSLPPPSFAQIVKTTASLDHQIQNKQQGIDEKTIIITAKTDQSPANVLLQVNNTIKDIRNNDQPFKINKIIKSKSGVIMKFPSDENIDQLIEEFQKYDQLNEIATIYKPSPLDPTIVLKSISKITNITEIPTLLCKMNPQLVGCEKKIKVLFAMKSTSDVQDIVLRVCPKVYEIIMKTGQIYTDIQVANVRNKVLIRQCQSCFQFDHSTRNCTNHKSCIICGAKGEHTCTKITRCSNCSSHPKYKENIDHLPNNRSCPIYLDRIQRQIQKTCFSGLDHDIIELPRTSLQHGSQ